MKFYSQILNLAPDPFLIVQSLAARPGVTLLFADRGRVAYVASDPLAVSSDLDPEPGLTRGPDFDEGGVPRWVGLIPYEACRQFELEGARDPRPPPLVHAPLWLRFGAVARIDNRVTVIGDEASAVGALSERLQRPASASGAPIHLAPLHPFEPGSQHTARIRRALAHIGRGDIYEVNLARRLSVSVAGAPWDILRALGTPELPPYAFALRIGALDVVAATPELCLVLEPNGRVQTCPIKGTRPRDSDPGRDLELARELDADPKERAELTMVIDIERNDLGRVAIPGSVQVLGQPKVISLPSVHHREAIVVAEIDAEMSRTQLFLAMLPSGSVTGAPKRRAMQLIQELEPHRRGLYTGVVGFIRQDGGVELSMAIRTLVSWDGIGHYFTGGGIVADSDPDREVEETRWKAERLTALIQRCAGSAEKWAD